MATKRSGKKSNLTNKQLRFLHAQLDDGAGGSGGSAPKAKPKASSKPKRSSFAEEDYKIPRNLLRRDLKQSDEEAISQLGDWARAVKPNGREIKDEEQLIPKDHPEYQQRVDALQSYRGFAYQAVNTLLRTGVEETQGTQKRVDLIDRVFAENARPLMKPVVVARGVTREYAKKLIADVNTGRLAAGSALEDQAFLSTSQSLTHARNFSGGGRDTLRFELTAPKGMKAVFMGQQAEGELLFNRGSRVRVTDVKMDVDGQYVVSGRLE